MEEERKRLSLEARAESITRKLSIKKMEIVRYEDA